MELLSHIEADDRAIRVIVEENSSRSPAVPPCVLAIDEERIGVYPQSGFSNPTLNSRTDQEKIWTFERVHRGIDGSKAAQHAKSTKVFIDPSRILEEREPGELIAY